ncbi:FkbM family methyltransferase [Cyanobacteria bacterium FACHB-472]|nr:FkbM family methyltransferase [Cyanobacteria bacterium FACHB-472]
MNFELKLIMFLGRYLPQLPHMSAIINRLLKPFYLRKKREEVTVGVFDFKMKLNPDECVDGNLLFCPQLYDYKEVSFLKENLLPGSCFIDIGAYIGFYSLIASRLVGDSGRVIAVEADLYNYNKLIENIEINSMMNIKAVNVGISNQREVLKIGLNLKGNRGGNSFFVEKEDGIDVLCIPLKEMLLDIDKNITRIDGVKIDIEGFEFRVLDKFFKEINFDLYPKFIIVEHLEEWITKAGGNTIEFLITKGYKIHDKSRYNYIMVWGNN